MDELGCDYECRTVGESIIKYNISDNWCIEFDAFDDAYPIFCIQADQVRKMTSIMDLKLRIVDNENEEFAGCMVRTKEKTIAFKIDHISDLIRAMGNE